MYIGIATTVVLIWFIGGVLYRERIFYKAAHESAIQYNKLIKAMEKEIGEQEFSLVLRKHKLCPSMDSSISKGPWGWRMGW